MKTKRNTILAWVIVLPLLALEIYGLVAAKKADPLSLGTAAITLCAVFAAFYLWRRRGGERVDADERTVRIANRAGTYSWLTTLFAIVAFSYLDGIEILRLPASRVLFYLLLVSSLSFWVFRYILQKSGDVD